MRPLRSQTETVESQMAAVGVATLAARAGEGTAAAASTDVVVTPMTTSVNHRRREEIGCKGKSAHCSLLLSAKIADERRRRCNDPTPVGRDNDGANACVCMIPPWTTANAIIVDGFILSFYLCRTTVENYDPMMELEHLKY